MLERRSFPGNSTFQHHERRVFQDGERCGSVRSRRCITSEVSDARVTDRWQTRRMTGRAAAQRS